MFVIFMTKHNGVFIIIFYYMAEKQNKLSDIEHSLLGLHKL